MLHGGKASHHPPTDTKAADHKDNKPEHKPAEKDKPAGSAVKPGTATKPK